MILFPLGTLFAMLGPIFVKKKFKVSAIFAGLKIKPPLCVEEHRVDLLFLPTLTIDLIASQVFDRFVFIFLVNPGNIFLAYLIFVLILIFYIPHEFLIFLFAFIVLQYFIKRISVTRIKCRK